MLLSDKNAVIYGAAGSMGSAVARVFAREGARVRLAGRTLASLAAVATEIVLPAVTPRWRRSTRSISTPSRRTRTR